MRRRHRGTTRPFHALTAAALVVGLQLAAPAAGAATTTVDCDTDSLSDAIAAASPGDTLKISGVCTGQFIVDKNLTLTGAPNAEIDGGGAGRPLTVFSFHTVHLNHLTVTGGVPRRRRDPVRRRAPDA